jgi:hypothetical protein
MKIILDRAAAFAPDKFPILAKCVGSEKVVWFTSSTRGVVLIGDISHTAGETVDNWVGIDRPEVWEVLPVGTEVRLVQE